MRKIVPPIALALTTKALPGELDGFDTKACNAAAMFCATALAERTLGQPIVQLEALQTEDARRRMRLVVVNDDMPFLVDSIAGAVGAHGPSIDRLLHPVVHVRRDGHGKLLSMVDSNADGCRESLVYLETGHLDPSKRDALIADLESTLTQVRAAVNDWVPMQEAMAADALRCGESESAALLNWLLNFNFTMLGACHFTRDGEISAPLGIARVCGAQLLSAAARTRAFAWFKTHDAGHLAFKSNMISVVHRRVLLDIVLVPVRERGRLVALSVHIGLWTSAALSARPEDVPILRQRLAALSDKFGFLPSSHTAKALTHALTALPHDLLISVSTEALEHLALVSMSLTDRPRPQLALVPAPLHRHIFAFVWLPRDDLTTQRRLMIGAMLSKAAEATILNWSIDLGDNQLALIRYTLDVRKSETQPDTEALNLRLQQMVRGWAEGVEQYLRRIVNADEALRVATQLADRFPQPYRAAHSPEDAAHDALALDALTGLSARGVRLIGDAHNTGQLWLKIYSLGLLALSDVVPVLENFGFRVLEEEPTALTDEAGCIHAFLLSRGEGAEALPEDRHPILIEAVSAVLEGNAENDLFNKLIVNAGLPIHGVVLFRALFRYLRQTGLSYSLETVVNALAGAPMVSQAIANLFQAYHDPELSARDAAIKAAAHAIDKGLHAVETIDDDRILRLMRDLVQAILRTNAFAPGGREALAFKLDSAAIPGLPAPVPWREIFVYSPRVEGIHLRSGMVARGGLRWSDRRDDFRTEILGLMKAQRVKNAVIVPTGAKGGFYPKRLPAAARREAWLAEGTACYQIFIRALLSVTDNIVEGAVVHPPQVHCRDGDDPYFVVAADKGTASFSDVANAIALERNFWLGDAFASGGSVGYDHKAMGITAKGAWVSVTRHFAEMGVDVQHDAFRVIGCGDMSGDVFGNGMLLSKSIHLVAAFDHRHIFIDPTPDAARSWDERTRLFALPRSSWADYDSSLISKGGGVFSRSEKSIKLTPQIKRLLVTDAESLDPSALIKALLCAQVDLLWFGGIGTYIKASHESHSAAGDRANDVNRVNAAEVLAKVIGEGANLGVTQAARIEFAQHGGRINTDFIDNSAGVDCSDHEVNIKIALNTMVADGEMSVPARNKLLAQMTDEVASLVLEDNRLQTLALSIAEAGGADALPSLIHLIEVFELNGQLDRRVEGIARNEDLFRRSGEQRKLHRPELAVLMATAKLAIQEAIEQSNLSDDPGQNEMLCAAFPKKMRKIAHDAITTHQLRKEIIATQTANRLVNRMGLVHPFELAEEEGVGLADVADAFIVCEHLFNMPSLWNAIDTAPMSEAARIHMFDQTAVELRAHMADMLRNSVHGRSPSAAAAALAPGIKQLESDLNALLPAPARAQANRFNERLCTMGVPKALAGRVVRLAELDGAIGLVSLALRSGGDARAITEGFITLGDVLGIDWVQGFAMEMNPSDPWERLLAAGLARDFHTMRLNWLARHVGHDAGQSVRDWAGANHMRIAQFRQVIDRARHSDLPSLAMLAQIASQARTLLSAWTS